jgi:hypothetical protein
MSLETFFGGFTVLGIRCVASFPVNGNEAMMFLKMLGVWVESAKTLRTCKSAKGMGVIAGCSEFTEPPQLTALYFISCDGTQDQFTASGTILIPITAEHQPCAEAMVIELAARAAAEAGRKGLQLIS